MSLLSCLSWVRGATMNKWTVHYYTDGCAGPVVKSLRAAHACAAIGAAVAWWRSFSAAGAIAYVRIGSSAAHVVGIAGSL